MEYINFQSCCDLKNVELKVDYSLRYSHEQPSAIEPKEFNKIAMGEGEVVTLNVAGRLVTFFKQYRTTFTSTTFTLALKCITDMRLCHSNE